MNSPRKVRVEFILWAILALTLHIPFDLITTLLAARKYGIHFESNPVVRGFLQQGLKVTVVNNLAIFVVVSALFTVLYVIVSRTTSEITRRVALLWVRSIAWLGVVIVSNNILVLIFGAGLVSLLL